MKNADLLNQQNKDAAAQADVERRKKMKAAAERAAGGAGGKVNLTAGGSEEPAAVQMAFKRKPLEGGSGSLAADASGGAADGEDGYQRGRFLPWRLRRDKPPRGC